MADASAEREQIVQYLLGQLSEDEMDNIASRSFSDSMYAEFVDEVEFEMIAGYVRNELPATQRERFRSHFLITRERQEQVTALATIVNYQGDLIAMRDRERSLQVKESAKASPWTRIVTLPRVAVAAMLLALVGSQTWLLREWWSRRDAPIVTTGLMDPKISLLSSRGAKAPTDLVIKQAAALVSLNLAVPTIGGMFIVELQKNGKALWREEHITPATYAGETVLSVQIPAANFRGGEEYRIVWTIENGSKEPAYTTYRVKTE